jgi:ketosteroid isomerase-like protein
MSKAQDTEAIFRGVVAAIDRGDVETIVESFAEDCVLVDYSNPAVVHRGRAAVADVVRAFFEIMPDLKAEVTHLVADENCVAGEVLGRGTPKGQTEPIEMHYVIIDVFQDGKIVSEHLYIDSRELPAGL